MHRETHIRLSLTAWDSLHCCTSLWEPAIRTKLIAHVGFTQILE